MTASRSSSGVVVEPLGGGHYALVVADDGQRLHLDLQGIRHCSTRLPQIGGSHAETLLIAVARWQPPKPAVAEILKIAGQLAAQLSPDRQIDFAKRAYANGFKSATAQLDLPEATRIWLAVSALASQGDWHNAAKTAVQLPERRFPGRYAVWAAALPSLEVDDCESILRALDRAQPESLPERVAQETLRVNLRQRVGDDAASAAGLRSTLNENPHEWESLRQEAIDQGSSPESKVLRHFRDKSLDSTTPSRVDALPTALLDDLVDMGILNAAWLEANEHSNTTNLGYLEARLRPDTVPTPMLGTYGLDHERARRALFHGGTLPPDLPSDVRAKFAPYDALLNGDSKTEAATQILEQDEPSLAKELRAVASSGQVPSDDLLTHPVAKPALKELQSNLQDPEMFRTTARSQEQRKYVARLSLSRAMTALRSWEYSESAKLAQAALDLTGDGHEAAEAHNVLALLGWLEDRDSAALQHLRKAIGISGALGLVGNLALAAERAEPATAVWAFSQVAAREHVAPRRSAAALRAVGAADAAISAGDQTPPQHVLTALRSLLRDDHDEEVLRHVGGWLCEYDRSWLASANEADYEPNADSPALRLRIADARGPLEFIRVLGTMLHQTREDGPIREWLFAERDGFVDELVYHLASDEPAAAASGLADALVDSAVPLEPLTIIRLRALHARAVALACSQEEGVEPAYEVLDGIEKAAAGANSVAPADRETADDLLLMGFDALLAVYLTRRIQLLQHAASRFQEVVDAISGQAQWAIKASQVESFLNEIRTVPVESQELLSRFRRRVSSELEDEMQHILSGCAGLVRSIDEVKAQI